MHHFQLLNGRYREITPPEQRLWLPEAGLGLGLWQGVYHGVERRWLRFYEASGNWIPTPMEQENQRVQQERQRAEQAQRRAEQAQRRVERLEARLRALGIEPDEE